MNRPIKTSFISANVSKAFMSSIHILLNVIAVCFLILAFDVDAKAGVRTDKAVEEFVRATAQKVKSILNSRITPEAQESQLNELFYQLVDYEWMGKFVVAQFWREMGPQYQQQYLSSYKEYLASSYVLHFKNYNGQRFVVNNVKEINPNQYFVSSTVTPSDNARPPLNIAYRLKLYPNGTIKIIDIIGENISLLATQRADFTSIIKTEGVVKFIQSLQSKAKKNKST